jgi:hypothetical protein
LKHQDFQVLAFGLKKLLLYALILIYSLILLLLFLHHYHFSTIIIIPLICSTVVNHHSIPHYPHYVQHLCLYLHIFNIEFKICMYNITTGEPSRINFNFGCSPIGNF